MRAVLSNNLPISTYSNTLPPINSNYNQNDQQQMSAGRTLLQILSDIREHLYGAVEYSSTDEWLDELVDKRIAIERQIANTFPTCIEDAIIQLEIVNEECSMAVGCKPNDPLVLEGDGCVDRINTQAIRTALSYLKFLQAKETPIAAATVSPLLLKQKLIQDPIVNLWHEMKRADAEYNSIIDLRDSIYTALPEEGKEPSIQYGRLLKDDGKHELLYTYSEEDFIRIASERLAGEEALFKGANYWEEVKSKRLESQQRKLAEFREKQAIAREIQEKAGYLAILEKENLAMSYFSDLDKKFRSTIATTHEGLSLQLKELREHLDVFQSGEWSERLFTTIEVGIKKLTPQMQ